MLKYCAANRKRRLSWLPNVGPYTRDIKTSGFTRSSIYRVIHKFLRDFRPLRYGSRDGHAEGQHVNRGRETASFCPALQVLDMCTLGDATDVKFWQIPRHRQLTYSLPTPCFVTTAPLAVKPASMPRRLVQKKT
jgi:hypothetical protein